MSASVGFVLGLIVVYVLSGRYVFGDSKITSKSKEFLLFAGTSTGKVYESYWAPGSGVIISGQFMRVDGQVTSTTFTAT